jgi:hypothetical protein
MRMHADLDVSKPVSPRRKHCLALLWRRRLSRRHHRLQSLLIRGIGRAVATVLAAQLRRSEVPQVGDALAYFGEEGRVR